MGWSDNVEGRLSGLQENVAAALRIVLLPVIKGKRVTGVSSVSGGVVAGVVVELTDDMDVKVIDAEGDHDWVALKDMVVETGHDSVG
jgi:hypothetical protein